MKAHFCNNIFIKKMYWKYLIMDTILSSINLCHKNKEG